MPAPSELELAIGRMLMVGVRGATIADAALHEDLDACRSAHVGGVILFDTDAHAAHKLAAQGLPREQARAQSPRNILSPKQTRTFCAVLREALGDNVLVAVDQEGGAVARLSPARGFDETLSAERFGQLDADGRTAAARALARQVAHSGFNVNFAPCVDVALNPDNPIISKLGRAFSSDPRLVAACAAAVIDAHHELNINACLKHFPGHGSSLADTHEGFVDITAVHRPDAELAPYEWLLRLPPPEARVRMVMTGHLYNSTIDAAHPASLSRRHTNDLLRTRLGFDGVVVVDSLDMGAVTSRYSPEEALVLAINAGADILLDCNNAPSNSTPPRPCPARAMHEAVSRAVRDGLIDGAAERILASARRIDRLFRPFHAEP